MGRGRSLVAFLAVLLAISLRSSAVSVPAATVVGVGECGDCAESNVRGADAFKGLRVAVVCKAGSGIYKPKGAEAGFDKDGKFAIPLPSGLLDPTTGRLKQECFAQLVASSKTAAPAATPCPLQQELDQFKIVLKKMDKSNHVFGTAAGKLTFSRTACTAAFLWPFPKFKPSFPPKTYVPIYKPKPKVYVPIYKPPKTYVPIYKPPKSYTPVYTPVPVYKPPKSYTPVYTPVPVYKPPKSYTPVYKPVPLYKAPKSYTPVYKPVPLYKAPKSYAPVYKPVPLYKPPKTYTPVYKKPPCPTLPVLPPYHKFPPATTKN